jgi:hypothetical protein
LPAPCVFSVCCCFLIAFCSLRCESVPCTRESKLQLGTAVRVPRSWSEAMWDRGQTSQGRQRSLLSNILFFYSIVRSFVCLRLFHSVTWRKIPWDVPVYSLVRTLQLVPVTKQHVMPTSRAVSVTVTCVTLRGAVWCSSAVLVKSGREKKGTSLAGRKSCKDYLFLSWCLCYKRHGPWCCVTTIQSTFVEVLKARRMGWSGMAEWPCNT